MTEDEFREWETSVFGYGYGTGEPFIIGALKSFLAACDDDGCYDYRRLEWICGPTITWLLINALCHCDVIEYGTSPRFGWLTTAGRDLRLFVSNRTQDQLLAIIFSEGA